MEALGSSLRYEPPVCLCGPLNLSRLEREQEDLLIIRHYSLIRCIPVYIIGLPASESEIPARVETAREVTAASYGVHSQIWDYAEDTKGKNKPDVEHRL